MTSSLRTVSLDDKYKLDQTKTCLTGVEALVPSPILQHQGDQERGLNTAGFVSGYRGYGHVKHANYQQYRLRLAQQLKRYQSPPPLRVEAAQVA